MKHNVLRSFLLAGLLALTGMAFANDAEVANKLNGNWEGEWSVAQYRGKFVLVVNGIEGNTVKGEGHFYDTATGDTKEPLSKAVVENGVLVASQPSGMALKLKLSDDQTLKGSWATGPFMGDIKATRK